MQAKGSPKDADVGRSQQAHRKSDRLLARVTRAKGIRSDGSSRGNGTRGEVTSGKSIRSGGTRTNGTRRTVKTAEDIRGNGRAGKGIAGKGIAGKGIAGKGIAGKGIGGKGIAGKGIAGKGIAGKGIAGKGIRANGTRVNVSLAKVQGHPGQGHAGVAGIIRVRADCAEASPPEHPGHRAGLGVAVFEQQPAVRQQVPGGAIDDCGQRVQTRRPRRERNAGLRREFCERGVIGRHIGGVGDDDVEPLAGYGLEPRTQAPFHAPQRELAAVFPGYGKRRGRNVGGGHMRAGAFGGDGQCDRTAARAEVENPPACILRA
jgi:hypothetical protein